jgi:hypothetical protein
MRRPPHQRAQRILDRPMLIRACGWLTLLEAMLVTGAFFWLLTCPRSSRCSAPPH